MGSARDSKGMLLFSFLFVAEALILISFVIQIYLLLPWGTLCSMLPFTFIAIIFPVGGTIFLPTPFSSRQSDTVAE